MHLIQESEFTFKSKRSSQNSVCEKAFLIPDHYSSSNKNLQLSTNFNSLSSFNFMQVTKRVIANTYYRNHSEDGASLISYQRCCILFKSSVYDRHGYKIYIIKYNLVYLPEKPLTAMIIMKQRLGNDSIVHNIFKQTLLNMFLRFCSKRGVFNIKNKNYVCYK